MKQQVLMFVLTSLIAATIIVVVYCIWNFVTGQYMTADDILYGGMAIAVGVPLGCCYMLWLLDLECCPI
jgi:hypothetical protein